VFDLNYDARLAVDADNRTRESGIGVGYLEVVMTGKIRTLRVDKGFGFIKDAAGKEYFFHQSAVQGEKIDNLREGDSVEFEVGEGPKGPRAENVRRTST
jgi:CspA family cold shock protein